MRARRPSDFREPNRTIAFENVSPEELGVAGFLAQQVFNEKKDLGAYVLMARIVIQSSLSNAGSDSNKSAEFKDIAIRTSYNLAANTWKGWGEDEVEIGDQEAKVGLEAAEFNVKLAEELNLPPNRRKNGCWILGAHMLSAGNYDQAKEMFATSKDFANEADLPVDALMAQGWVHLCEILSNGASRDQLDAAIEKLMESGEDGQFYAEQYETAMRVFGSK